MAARRERRRRQVTTTLALFASLSAIGGAGLAWAIRLGIANAAGIDLSLLAG